MKMWKKIVTVISIFVVGYMVGCWLEVNAHNSTDKKYSDWNILVYGFEWFGTEKLRDYDSIRLMK